jgi:hypothetical protein
MNDIEKNIQSARKVSTAYRNLSKVSVIREEGNVKLNTGVIAKNLPEDVAADLELSMKHFLESLKMWLKGKSQDMFENVYGEDQGTIPEGMTLEGGEGLGSESSETYHKEEDFIGSVE